MYVKLFSSIYQGTLRGNSNGLLVFTNLLAHADRDGVADIHPRAVSEETGLDVESVKVALLMLESPDDESRSPEEQGRRIIRIDEHRAWGWQIVNYAKYREIRNEEDRREQNREAQQRWRDKKKSAQSASVSHDKPLSAHAEAYTDPFNTSTTNVVLAPKSAILDCPHAEILQLWAEVMPDLPQHDPEMWPNSARAANLRSRWRSTAAAKHWESKDDGLAYFRKFFLWCRNSQFLMGKVNPKKDARAFELELAWLVNATNWTKVHEGKYHA